MPQSILDGFTITAGVEHAGEVDSLDLFPGQTRVADSSNLDSLNESPPKLRVGSTA